MSLTCQVCSRSSCQGNLPHGHLQSLSFCWQPKQLLLVFCASDGARERCLDSAHLCVAVDPQDSPTSQTQVVTLSEHMGISACQIQSPFKPGRGSDGHQCVLL